ncbi:uncharacterized protein N7477_002903 [Penicillium maclennaniae]|uniref:uncharacterized protein n=1 Tax=Penicillium maclennaniae TaxID=1343394 RepID=UPI002540F02C|nr:uncharacterized protein N7477_002903 [Penicillium maclennaniae]KAJ5677270.1 hypothetical protein N7477_002903 [Penicillium maclennaniae]
MTSISADRSQMAGSATTAATAESSGRPQNLQDSWTSESSGNAVASESPIHYSSFSSSDSDDPLQSSNEVNEDDASDVVGVSIGRAQSRMKARSTPAEEKSRALESNGGYFSAIPDPVSEDGLFVSQLSAEPEQLEPRRSSKVQTTHPATRSSVEHRTPRGRHTHHSVPKGTGGPPIEFHPLPTQDFLAQTPPCMPTSPRAPSVSPYEDEDDARPISELQSLHGSSVVKHSYSRRPSATPKRPPSLRRSSSDQSLYLRASSTASSLEQRPLYTNVHSQVNSRFKAIKDSLQDSSSRLLSMPSLHLQDIRGEWAGRPFFNENSPNTNASGDKGINGHASAPPPPPPRNHPQSTHPILEEAMRDLVGDVVILGGYRGSILRSAKPPHRQLWVPMKVGLNLRKVDLEVGLTREDEERMPETVIPSGVLSHVGPVDVCRRLMKRLRKCDNAMRGDLRVWDYGYDWRLSPDLLSKQLIEFLERLPCNRGSSDGKLPTRRGATVIAHSLGGLITRHAVNQRPDLFAGVVYAGVPQHCVNILGPLRNGDDVLLSSRVLTAQVNFTFRTSFALLPEDGHCFIDKQSKKEFRMRLLRPQKLGRIPPLPLLKRFSFGARDELNINESETNDTNTSTEDDNPHRVGHLPRSSTAPIHMTSSSSDNFSDKFSNKVNDTVDKAHDKAHDKAQEKASEAVPSVDGLVGPNPSPRGSAGASKASTTCTIPHAAAMEYLQRTLAEVKRFKFELDFQPSHQMENRYPPAAVIYGKSVPTVYGARVTSREAIKRTDCYDDLAFAAGDGVCLASAAMLPPGYRIIKHGLVKSERGHVGLLGDLEGVGQCLRAIIRGRKEGVGLGNYKE